ncbi:hypothetical protein PIROE2DRAFT_9733 [Piromyces sp. E2]|nr:hypothetical protein PIROE2DRAFT_9733 [Piromyces sp. E2]|eukprot:OUM63658.1 hypothetical protein PIROE2DRAFT_9733 [Piromyces sp. E2]
MLHGRSVIIICECFDSGQIRLVQTVSLGEKLSKACEMSFSPVITVAMDPVKDYDVYLAQEGGNHDYKLYANVESQNVSDVQKDDNGNCH